MVAGPCGAARPTREYGGVTPRPERGVPGGAQARPHPRRRRRLGLARHRGGRSRRRGLRGYHDAGLPGPGGPLRRLPADRRRSIGADEGPSGEILDGARRDVRGRNHQDQRRLPAQRDGHEIAFRIEGQPVIDEPVDRQAVHRGRAEHVAVRRGLRRSGDTDVAAAAEAARFSTTTGCPSRSRRPSAMRRPARSTAPPGGYGTMSRRGRSGQAWALAGPARHVGAAPQPAAREVRRCCTGNALRTLAASFGATGPARGRPADRGAGERAPPSRRRAPPSQCRRSPP